MRFSVEKLIGMSNDTVSYVKNTNDFVENAQIMTGLDIAEVEKVLMFYL